MLTTVLKKRLDRASNCSMTHKLMHQNVACRSQKPRETVFTINCESVLDQVNSGLSKENVLTMSCEPILDQVNSGVSRDPIFTINCEPIMDKVFLALTPKMFSLPIVNLL